MNTMLLLEASPLMGIVTIFNSHDLFVGVDDDRERPWLFRRRHTRLE
jgi:hypothetical protein